MVVLPSSVICEPLGPLGIPLIPQPLVKQHCLCCTKCACNVSVVAQIMLQGQGWRVSVVGSHCPHGQGQGVIGWKNSWLRNAWDCNQRGIGGMNQSFFSTTEKKKTTSFSLHLACSNRCIYVAVTETAMYSNRHPTGTLNKLACHTWEIRLNNLTASEVVSFACITPGFLPFTGHWSKEKVLTWNDVLTQCPLGVT